MKHFFRRKGIVRKIAMLMVMIVAISFFPMSSTRADNEGDSSLDKLKQELLNAEREKQEKQQKLDEAKGNLALTESSLKDLNSIKNTYQGQLNSLNTELEAVAGRIEIIEAELELKQVEIKETEILLEEAKENSINQYASMKKRIQFLYENGDNVYLEMLLSAESFGEFLNYADYIEQLSAYDRQMLVEYIETQESISNNLAKLEQEKADIETLEHEAVEEQKKVMGLITVTSDNIASTADDINSVANLAKAYEADCDKKAAEAAAANASYEAIKKEYEEELRLSQLAAVSSWRDISQVVFEEGDRYLLANLIYCEAGGEPYEGQVAVGAVVINRVLSSVFPNTVTGVIYQRKQFSPVLDGHLASALANNKATESCYRAADEAMAGATPVGGCVFFRTPIEGLNGLQIGHHIFY